METYKIGKFECRAERVEEGNSENVKASYIRIYPVGREYRFTYYIVKSDGNIDKWIGDGNPHASDLHPMELFIVIYKIDNELAYGCLGKEKVKQVKDEDPLKHKKYLRDLDLLEKKLRENAADLNCTS